MKVVKSNGNLLLVLKEDNKLDEFIKPNNVDASFEKHVPNYEIKGNKVEVFVDHVMENNHYIEWIMAEYKDRQIIKYLNPGDDPKMIIEYEEGMVLYSYCNKHSLWMNDKVVMKVKL